MMWGGYSYTALDEVGGGKFHDVWQRVGKSAAARELSKLANLRQLVLFGRGQWGECLFKALQQLNHLTLLQLNGMNYSHEHAEQLTGGEAGLIASLTGLQVLDVTDYYLQEAQLLTRLCFTTAADMSTVFVQALKSFKFTKGRPTVCTIESTAKVSLPGWIWYFYNGLHVPHMHCMVPSAPCCW